MTGHNLASSPDDTRTPTEDLPDHTLAALLRNLSDAVVVADRNGSIVFWNDAATAMFGWPGADAIGQTLDLIIPERLRQRHWAGFETAMATGATRYADRVLEVPAIQRDGEPLSIAFTVTMVSPTPGEPPELIAAVIRDDTQRWRDNRALVAELEELRHQAPQSD